MDLLFASARPMIDIKNIKSKKTDKIMDDLMSNYVIIESILYDKELKTNQTENIVMFDFMNENEDVLEKVKMLDNLHIKDILANNYDNENGFEENPEMFILSGPGFAVYDKFTGNFISVFTISQPCKVRSNDDVILVGKIFNVIGVYKESQKNKFIEFLDKFKYIIKDERTKIVLENNVHDNFIIIPTYPIIYLFDKSYFYEKLNNILNMSKSTYPFKISKGDNKQDYTSIFSLEIPNHINEFLGNVIETENNKSIYAKFYKRASLTNSFLISSDDNLFLELKDSYIDKELELSTQNPITIANILFIVDKASKDIIKKISDSSRNKGVILNKVFNILNSIFGISFENYYRKELSKLFVPNLLIGNIFLGNSVRRYDVSKFVWSKYCMDVFKSFIIDSSSEISKYKFKEILNLLEDYYDKNSNSYNFRKIIHHWLSDYKDIYTNILGNIKFKVCRTSASTKILKLFDIINEAIDFTTHQLLYNYDKRSQSIFRKMISNLRLLLRDFNVLLDIIVINNAEFIKKVYLSTNHDRDFEINHDSRLLSKIFHNVVKDFSLYIENDNGKRDRYTINENLMLNLYKDFKTEFCTVSDFTLITKDKKIINLNNNVLVLIKILSHYNTFNFCNSFSNVMIGKKDDEYGNIKFNYENSAYSFKLPIRILVEVKKKPNNESSNDPDDESDEQTNNINSEQTDSDITNIIVANYIPYYISNFPITFEIANDN